MPQERLSNEALHAKANTQRQLDDLEIYESMALSILDEIVWDFTQAK